jgi:hypothetical protein
MTRRHRRSRVTGRGRISCAGPSTSTCWPARAAGDAFACWAPSRTLRRSARSSTASRCLLNDWIARRLPSRWSRQPSRLRPETVRSPSPLGASGDVCLACRPGAFGVSSGRRSAPSEFLDDPVVRAVSRAKHEPEPPPLTATLREAFMSLTLPRESQTRTPAASGADGTARSLTLERARGGVPADAGDFSVPSVDRRKPRCARSVADRPTWRRPS